MKTILVTGIGGPAGRNVTQLLLARGHAVVGTDMRDVSMPGISFHIIPAANDPSFLERLLQIATQEKTDLLIPTVTEELPIVAEHWSDRGGIPAMIGPFAAVYTANDKYLTAEHLAQNGVAVPRYCLPSQVKSAADIAQATGWPCLSKPRIGRGGRGVTVWGEKDYALMHALDDRSILQEFLPGTDYAPNVCIGRAGHATVIVLEKTRLREGNVGNAAEVQRVVAPDVAELAIAAAKALGFTGPLDIDIRRRADGNPAVLEINARFGANIAHAPEVLDAALASFGIQ
jgi:carbamoylphosphate synthase large subunit